MRRALALFSLIAAVLIAAGCIDRTEKVTLNPDGSGMSQLDIYINPPQMPNFGGGPATPKALTADDAKRLAAGMVNGAEGVDAWSDVSYELAADGRVHFKGTAYFKDLSKFKVENFGGMNQKSNEKVAWAADPKGGMSLTISVVTDHPPKPDAAPMTDDQIAQEITTFRQQWVQGKPMITSFLEKLKMDTTYVLPGTIDEATVFEKTANGNGVRIVLDGKKVIDSFDKLVNDDAALKDAMKRGMTGQQPPDEETFNQLLHGVKGKTRAHVGGDLKPLFDYKTQMEAARAAQPEMVKKLGLDQPMENTPPRMIPPGAEVPPQQ